MELFEKWKGDFYGQQCTWTTIFRVVTTTAFLKSDKINKINKLKP